MAPFAIRSVGFYASEADVPPCSQPPPSRGRARAEGRAVEVHREGKMHFARYRVSCPKFGGPPTEEPPNRRPSEPNRRDSMWPGLHGRALAIEGSMDDEERAELDRLRAETERLKRTQGRGTIKVSEKGASRAAVRPGWTRTHRDQSGQA